MSPEEAAARNAIDRAADWLIEHRDHHSARRSDVRALIAALEALLNQNNEGRTP